MTAPSGGKKTEPRRTLRTRRKSKIESLIFHSSSAPHPLFFVFFVFFVVKSLDLDLMQRDFSKA